MGYAQRISDPSQLTSLCDLPLGVGEKDVRFDKGNPSLLKKIYVFSCILGLEIYFNFNRCERKPKGSNLLASKRRSHIGSQLFVLEILINNCIKVAIPSLFLETFLAENGVGKEPEGIKPPRFHGEVEGFKPSPNMIHLDMW